VNGAPGQPRREGRGGERRREADIGDVDAFADGRALDCLAERDVEIPQS